MLFLSFTVGLYKRITLKKHASEIIYLYNFIHKKGGGAVFHESGAQPSFLERIKFTLVW